MKDMIVCEGRGIEGSAISGALSNEMVWLLGGRGRWMNGR